jgi:hypothetical protein
VLTIIGPLGSSKISNRSGTMHASVRSPPRDFLTLWKDADPDIPILKEAKAEYAKLQ